MFVVLYLLLFPVFTSSELQQNLTLVFVNTLWRHGARSPFTDFRTDSNTYIWPQGPAQLTQVGMKQQYKLGQFLKQRYGHFLSNMYNRTEIYVRSTDVDRTLMSAQCNLAGMFPPVNKQQQWNGSFTSWQPIPVHAVSVSNDLLLRFPLRHSPQYSAIMQKVWELPHLKQIAIENTMFLDELSNFTGKENLTIQNVNDIYDVLICEKFQNLSMPDWLTEDRMRKLVNISGIEMGTIFGLGTPFVEEIARLGAGQLVKQILDNMENRTYKMIAYSAHDTTIAALLVALNAYNKLPPPFASVVIFELYHQSSSGNYIVRSYYRNSSAEPPMQLQLLGCPLDCPLDELKRKAASLFPIQPNNSCISSDSDKNKNQIFIYLLVCLLLISWILMAISCFRRKRKRKSFSYQRLNNDVDDLQTMIVE